MPKSHLVVLLHGFLGGPGDFDNFVKVVEELDPCKDFLLLPVSKNNCTTDGIVNGATRAFEEVMSTIEENKQTLSKISVIGHSLGGLYGRYLVYLLDKHVVFNVLTPVVFVTLATPHLGIRRPPTNPINFVWNSVVSALCQTTKELGLVDSGTVQETNDNETNGGIPLLREMVEYPFIKSLKRFRKRALYTNTKYDFQVPYSTSAIRHSNPYKTRGTPEADDNINSDEEEEHEEEEQGEAQSRKRRRTNSGSVGCRWKAPVTASTKLSLDVPNFTQWSLDNVDLRKNWETAQHLEHGVIPLTSDANTKKRTREPDEFESEISELEEPEDLIAHSDYLEKAFRRDSRRDHLRSILLSLDIGVGGWERYDVAFNTVMSHEQIIYKRSFLPGRSVVEHFVKSVLVPAHSKAIIKDQVSSPAHVKVVMNT